VKHGIIGLWQIQRRDETFFKERIEIDLRYINNLGSFVFSVEQFL